MKELVASWVPLAACAAGLVCMFARAAGGRETARSPGLDRARGGAFRFGGVVGRRVRANVDHWLVRAPSANPAMLQ